MALDLTLLGATGVEAVAKLINYTLKTNINAKWITATGAGSPFQPKVQVTVAAKTTNDAQGNPPIYINSETITYNRVGFQKAFQGLNLMLHMTPPFKISDVVAKLQDEYGIVLEQADLLDQFGANALIDAQGFVTLQPGAGSLRYYIDYSPFRLKVAINQATETDLEKLIAMTQLADMDALNAQNTPPSTGSGLLPAAPDRAY